MDQQNNSQSNQQIQAQKPNTQNNRNQMDRQKPRNNDKRPSQERGFNQDRNRTDRNNAGDRVQNSQNFKVQGDSANAPRNRDQRGPNKPESTQPVRNQQHQPASQNQNQSQSQNPQQSNANNQSRYARGNAVKNTPHADAAARNIKPKRIETVEDIQADIERIDKDIQFEIKQIRAVKLGL